LSTGVGRCCEAASEATTQRQESFHQREMMV
jgi:hypothetical protein